MNNNKRLEIIMKIRERRDIIEKMTLSNEEKEIIRRSLNFYEQKLDNEIAKTNNNITELEEMDISSNEMRIKVPVEDSQIKYKEFANIYHIDINSVISSLLDKLRDSILLTSIREYALSLKELNDIHDKNKEEFKEYLGK